jgi:uncharacterized BrkB/YihY/UPF0761 family membrane protein
MQLQLCRIERKHHMSRSTRSLTGTIFMVLFVILYAMVVMLFSPLILKAAHDSFHIIIYHIVQVVYYFIAGVGWALPILPLIKWMNKPNE